MSRRNLSATSPFQTTDLPLRKRPLDEEDPIIKRPRLKETTPTHCTPTHNHNNGTPSRRRRTPITQHTPSTLDEDLPLTPVQPPHRSVNDSFAKINSTTFKSPEQSCYQRQRVLYRAPAEPHMTVTGSNGTRVYLKMDQNQRSTSRQSFTSQLLTTPIAELRERVEEEVCGVGV